MTRYTKQIVGCVLAGVVATGAPALAGVEVDPNLQVRLAGAPDGEIIPLYIVMADRVDRAGLAAQYPVGLYTASERRHLLTSQAKAVAASSQGDLLNFLRSRPITEVTLVRPLWIVNVVAFEAVPSVIQQTLSMPGIERAMLNEPEYVLPVEPQRKPEGGMARRGGSIAWSLVQIRAPEVWAMGITGEGVVVAHYDTGACYNHPDLAANTWINEGEIPGNGQDDDGNGFIDDDKGWDFGANDNDPDDDSGHGTHTMGSVVGDGTQGTQTGVAPGAKVMINKVLNFGFGDGPEVWEAYQYSLENGAHLATASIGWITGIHEKNRADWREASDNAIYAGLILVFAAGNERGFILVPESIRTPGDVPAVITVGATTMSDSIASFSSPGETEWGTSWLGENTDGPYRDWEWNQGGRIKPDIAAPGEDVNSTLDCSGYSGDTWSGTSMATPHIAGVIALMLQANPLLTRDDIIEIFAATSVDLGPPGMDNDFGWGRVDAFEAVTAAMTPTTIEVDLTAKATLITGGDPINITLTLENTTDVSQTFDLWMDLTLPDGTVLNDSFFGPRTMTMGAGSSGDFASSIPTSSQSNGTRVLTLKVGTFGVSVIDSKALPITLQP
ncbi:MAG: S8 family serine peptidase [Planctomycetes bacterium]|nr:S8 family serine peptidase [Planctomycetota bacterium]